ncbi:MAG: organomercurial lyase [Acidimicrobiales bacterium]
MPAATDDVSDLVQRTYTTVLRYFVDHGEPPHYTRLASLLDVAPVEARVAVHDASAVGLGCWVTDGTDYIGSFAPFHGTPTQYRIVVDDSPHWYAQCGLESFGVRWMFPGREVRIEASDLVTGEPITVRFDRDGALVAVDPDTTIGYINTPMWKWATVENTAHL